MSEDDFVEMVDVYLPKTGKRYIARKGEPIFLPENEVDYPDDGQPFAFIEFPTPLEPPRE